MYKRGDIYEIKYRDACTGRSVVDVVQVLHYDDKYLEAGIMDSTRASDRGTFAVYGGLKYDDVRRLDPYGY